MRKHSSTHDYEDHLLLAVVVLLLFLHFRGSAFFSLVHNINFPLSHWTARWLAAVERGKEKPIY